ncbi:MAG: TonB-dependent receptor [Cytophagales bacterium]|nr:MAG: TonB-dependent receptor [Cytophagales bacterium]
MKRFHCTLLLFFLLLISTSNFVYAQKGDIISQIAWVGEQPPAEVRIFLKGTSYGVISPVKNEKFLLSQIPYGQYRLVVEAAGYNTFEQSINLSTPELVQEILMEEQNKTLEGITVEASSTQLGKKYLQGVENFGIYEAKKTEVIVLKDISANLSTNNPRQLFARIAGLNIWESDRAGLQLGIGGRGLSPNRTANFNTRQNGYDISADALGYPESYYTPPAEALEKIEIIRGAASLQYGTQFGGMLNFVMKKGEEKPFTVNLRQTIGSFGFWGTFNSIGGTIAKGKLNYYSFFQRKQGGGWRPNSVFEANNFYLFTQYQLSNRWKIALEYTYMDYLAQQAGGLTDLMFAQNPQQSVRARNWFKVNWNLWAMHLTYALSPNAQLNLRTFGLYASRQALGNLERINVADFGYNRSLIAGEFQNIGAEARWLQRYQWGRQMSALVIGARLYRGITSARQGDANNSANPDFYFLNPNNLENSDYTFPNDNIAFFAENIISLSEKWSLTPGIRWEYIRTQSEGYYRQRVFDFAGNIISDARIEDAQSRTRNFVLLGLGLSFKPNSKVELYANWSQNYRAINFSDLRIQNPNFIVDANIQDENGYSADMGFRGTVKKWLQFDVSAFYMAYNNRIGVLLKNDVPPLFNEYRYRTNIADAYNIGLESFVEFNFLPLILPETNHLLSIFANFSWIDARYLATQDKSIAGKKVEFVPPLMLRLGINFKSTHWKMGFQWLYTQEHYTDASNALRTSTAVNGIIPTYQVADCSVAYQWKYLQIEASMHNIFDARYFTRRAEGYPGPGIIPADGRNVALTVGVTF